MKKVYKFKGLKRPVTPYEIGSIALGIVNQMHPAGSLNEKQFRAAYVKALPQAWEMLLLAQEFLEQ
jgi:hypothetical protein